MTKLYFIRHAEAKANVSGHCYGITESDVTTHGKEQLARLAERFKDVHIEAIYSSPMKRTLTTAKAVNNHNDVALIEDKGLIEINAGIWETQKWDDLEGLYPEDFDIWVNKPHLWSVTDGESMAEVYDRMKETVGNIVRKNKGRTIVVVSHACALRNYFCYARGYSHERLVEVPHLHNTSVSCIEYDDDFNANTLFENDISHLEY